MKSKFLSTLASTPNPAAVSATCQAYLAQIICGTCEPFAAHLYPNGGSADAPLLCQDFCSQFTGACAASLGLPSNYCATRTVSVDSPYCYPYVVPVVQASGALQPLFPNLAGQFPNLPTGM